MTAAETYTQLFSTARKINLSKWVHADIRKPRKGQKVWVCDADYWGWADFEFKGRWNGKHFIVGRKIIQGISYWQSQNKFPK